MSEKQLKSISFEGFDLPDNYVLPDGLSDEAKEALLACFEHVAWIDEHGQDYYDALYSALYGTEPEPEPDPGIITVDVSKTALVGIHNNNPPGYISANVGNRITYQPFDLFLEPGNYKIDWESSDELVVNGFYYNVNCENLILNNQNLTNYCITMGSSYVAKGTTIIIPETVNGASFWCFRPTWKKSDDSTISSNTLTSITLTKE